MAEYQLTATDIVIRTTDNAHIPADPANSDYAEYLRWLDAGGIPDPYVEPVPTRRQEADAHLAAGLTVDFTEAQPGRGTYYVTGGFGTNISAIQTSLNTNNKFPDNKSMVGIFDIDYGMHNFDKKTFPVFTEIVSTFVHNCNLYAQGEVIDLPPNVVVVGALPEPLPTAEQKVIYDHENRLRAVEGLPPLDITLEEFIREP